MILKVPDAIEKEHDETVRLIAAKLYPNRQGLSSQQQLKTKRMEHKAKSIRPFIGAENFAISRSFYRDLGFEEKVLSDNMSVFKSGQLAFYLQDAYVKDWVDNTMVFMEVEDVDKFWEDLVALDLPGKYKNVKVTPIRVLSWGRECFVHDPSGILWHFGEFVK